MLKLENIVKTYTMGDLKVEALKGISLSFRKSEFVSILGPSGCGKTTMLNIIGGLDRYTSGDLLINGISTKQYKDKDWDAYRNHCIGFVFQSYNLIPHQSVLENVELALTLSGVSKEERKRRATEVLTKVGLQDKLKNKPSQLSGGQMQRVAIARALVNNPEIILADEPTGALDTESSVQIMEILKEISKDKLIIMVTHNPELAEKYSTRIVKLLDGNLIDDSMPYIEETQIHKENSNEIESVDEKTTQTDEERNAHLISESNLENNTSTQNTKIRKQKKKKRMSFFTALALSFKNLLTKKARTILVAFAGSIGIIGIALILAISSGFNAYVNKMQQDTLSSYPVELTNNSYDMSSLMQIFLNRDDSTEHEKDKVYVKDELTDMLSKFNMSSSSSDLASFKAYLEGDGKEEIQKYVSAIQYIYNVSVNAYYNSVENGLISANATTVFADIISSYPASHPDMYSSQDKQLRYGLLNYMFGSTSGYYTNEFWSEMLDNQDLLTSQYELVGENSKWATEYNEIMIVLDKNNEISDYTLYGLGLLDQKDLNTLLDNYINNKNSDPVIKTFTYDDLLSLDYRIILESDYFEYNSEENIYYDIRSLKGVNDELYNQKIQNLYNTKAIKIKVAGIIREKEDATALSINTVIAYSSKLTNYIVDANNNSIVVNTQLNNNSNNILTGQAFNDSIPLDVQKNVILSTLGYADLTKPEAIYLYPISFEAKNDISDFIDKYNNKVVANGEDDKVITYSDFVGTMMNSISIIISAITYVLIAFVGVSLIVSSIMIGIITYISVIERTKEIGVLRSVGASKKDVKRVFTAESFIIGLSSGIIGILIALLLTIPINILLKHFTNLSGVASLPVLGAIILIAISVILTLVAGLIPAHAAAKKDPVVALRDN